MEKVVLLFFIMFIACSNPAIEHARLKYPNCKVEDSGDDSVRVSCPNSEPFERKYRKAK